MSHPSRLPTLVSPLLAVVVTLALTCPSANAQVKPFKIRGAGLVDFVPLEPGVPAYHFAIGNATELGRYFGEGEVVLLGFTSPTSAEFESYVPCEFTAANGDKLVFTYGDTDNGAEDPGEVNLHYVGDGKFVAVWYAEFNPVIGASTGRFSKVIDGSFFMTAITEPFELGGPGPVAYSWEGSGWLEYKKGK